MAKQGGGGRLGDIEETEESGEHDGEARSPLQLSKKTPGVGRIPFYVHWILLATTDHAMPSLNY